MTANQSHSTKPHIAILGSGPTGLEAALAARRDGYPFTLFEAAPHIAGHISAWGHVQLFTPWSMNVSSSMRQALEAAGCTVPDDQRCPTGQELVTEVLVPLAELPGIEDHLRLAHRVVAVGRQGLLKHEEIGSRERGTRPFRLLVEDVENGRQQVAYADIVLDCTGNSVANAVGDAGIPAPGEAEAEPFIEHRIPDLDREAEGWAGRTVLLMGSGHSAQTALRDLVELAAKRPGGRIIWLRRSLGHDLGLVKGDPLPERARLTALAQQYLVDPPACLTLEAGAVVDALAVDGETLRVTLRDHRGQAKTLEVDRLLALTGKVGDHRLYRQLQIHECYATSGPMKLAAALLGASGGGGDCLAQTSLGPDTLKNPEPGFFILGSKAYGRRNDFLMRVGWQQVDEVFQLLRDSH